MKLNRKWAIAGVLALGAFTRFASADIIPSMPSTTSTPAGAGFQTFTYTADLTNDEKLQSGNFFTIYDIAGLSSASGPVGWTATEALTGLTPTFSAPPDNPSILNVTFTYTGLSTGAGPTNLGLFSVTTDAAHASVGTGFFAAEAIKATGTGLGNPIDNVGSVRIPIGTVSGNATPLPAGAFAAIPAVLLAAFFGRRAVAQRA